MHMIRFKGMMCGGRSVERQKGRKRQNKQHKDDKFINWFIIIKKYG